MDRSEENGMGITNTYDRKKYDDVYKRKKFKEEYFNNKKTTKDYITSETLHIDTNAAKNKYGSKHYTKHTADVDHIIPVKKVYEKSKNNPFLSDKDVRDIANAKSNYRVTQSSLNRAKSDSSNINYAKSSNIDSISKAKLVGDQAKAETSLAINTTIKTGTNIANDFKNGAQQTLEGAAIPIMVEGVHNLVQVAMGEKEFEEAAKDMTNLTTEIAVTGGSIKVTTTALTSIMKNSNSEQLKNFANSNQVAKIVAVAFIVKDSVFNYIEGKIDGGQFLYEIGEKGVGLVGATIGFEIGKDIGCIAGGFIGQALIPVPVVGAVVGEVVGSLVGAFVGSMIISIACTEIYKQAIRLFKSYNYVQEYERTLAKLNILVDEALEEMEYQREALKTLISDKYNEWDMEFDLGFKKIFESSLEDDYDGITEGINTILNALGEEVRFKTNEEFDDFFMDENAVFTF